MKKVSWFPTFPVTGNISGVHTAQVTEGVAQRTGKKAGLGTLGDSLGGPLALAWLEFRESSDVPPSSWHIQVSTSLSDSPAVALGRVRPPGGMGSVDCGDGDAALCGGQGRARLSAHLQKTVHSPRTHLHPLPGFDHPARPSPEVPTRG